MPQSALVICTDWLYIAGKQSAPEIYPRPDGPVYVCGEGDSNPLPDNPALISAAASHIKKLQVLSIESMSRMILRGLGVDCYIVDMERAK